MVVGAFPAVKLAVLAFKQLSKPVANTIKERAKSHPFFRKYVCMPPAQCKFTSYLLLPISINMFLIYFFYLNDKKI